MAIHQDIRRVLKSGTCWFGVNCWMSSYLIHITSSAIIVMFPLLVDRVMIWSHLSYNGNPRTLYLILLTYNVYMELMQNDDIYKSAEFCKGLIDCLKSLNSLNIHMLGASSCGRLLIFCEREKRINISLGHKHWQFLCPDKYSYLMH